MSYRTRPRARPRATPAPLHQHDADSASMRSRLAGPPLPYSVCQRIHAFSRSQSWPGAKAPSPNSVTAARGPDAAKQSDAMKGQGRTGDFQGQIETNRLRRLHGRRPLHRCRQPHWFRRERTIADGDSSHHISNLRRARGSASRTSVKRRLDSGVDRNQEKRCSSAGTLVESLPHLSIPTPWLSLRCSRVRRAARGNWAAMAVRTQRTQECQLGLCRCRNPACA